MALAKSVGGFFVLKRSISLFVNHFQENRYFILISAALAISQLLRSYIHVFFMLLFCTETWSMRPSGNIPVCCIFNIFVGLNTPVRCLGLILASLGSHRGQQKMINPSCDKLLCVRST